MTLITPNKGPSQLDADIIRILKQLRDIMADMEAKQDELRDGEGKEAAESKKLLGEIRGWMKVAIETEARIEERCKENQGIVRDYALDFAEARSEIGCRLDRLRRTRCPGRFPE